MSFRFLGISMLILLVGCAQDDAVRIDRDAVQDAWIATVARADSTAAVNHLLHQEILSFAELLDRFRRQQEDLHAAAEVILATPSDTVAPSAHLQDLLAAFTAVGAAAKDVATIAARHDPWRDDQGPLANQPLPLRWRGSRLSAAASLALYDAYQTESTVLADGTVRNVLDRGDDARGLPPGQVRRITYAWLDLFRRHRLRSTMDFLSTAAPADNPAEQMLTALIDASPSWPHLARRRTAPVDHLASLDDLVAQDLRVVSDTVLSRASGIFGNGIGLIAFRHGRLHGNPHHESVVTSYLQPGDLLLEKTPFRLTDRFIPGHWGHVALWVGTEAGGVCEALRSGVTLNPLNRFLNVDDLAILRPRDPAQAEPAVTRALTHVGKKYDFTFDVATADRIVCSELAWAAYPDVPWTTSRTLGRSTISPDQVASQALPGGAFTVVALWHGGVEITTDRDAQFANLLGSSTRPAPRTTENRPATWAKPVTLAGVDNLHQLTPNLYRCAQPDAAGMAALEQLGIVTVINLRAFHNDADELQRTNLLSKEISVHAWDIEEGDVIRVLRLLRDPAQGPFLIHCKHGADRTGLMCAMYRITAQGWTPEAAIEEMTEGGFGFWPGWRNIVRFIRQADIPRLQAAVAAP